ncbi:hypothetical protein DVH24_040337 [Malus domestica]|uniref:Uncharacterized protein n=1 Tax=Malus domestica TaxID=3750 RepID=A0A498I7H5_MALDO|nr:hypothetical protein DVH24_040337 [Malus domestica]
MVFASTPTTSTSHDNEWTGRIMRSSPQRKARFLGKVSFYAPSSSPSHHVHRLPAINGDPGKLYGDDKRIVHTGRKNESMALAFSSRSSPITLHIHIVALQHRMYSYRINLS